MEKDSLGKLLHNIKSKSVSIKNAADLFMDSGEKDREELAELMEKSAEELFKAVRKLSERE